MWISEEDDYPAEREILAAYVCGWDGKDPDDPDVDVVAMAIRSMFGDTDLTRDEAEKIGGRWPLLAEEWMNAQVTQVGHLFGWHEEAFYLETAEWWAERGGPDQAWTP